MKKLFIFPVSEKLLNLSCTKSEAAPQKNKHFTKIHPEHCPLLSRVVAAELVRVVPSPMDALSSRAGRHPQLNHFSSFTAAAPSACGLGSLSSGYLLR